MMTPQDRYEKHTLPFLDALAGIDAQYLFVTFDDNKARKDPGLTKQFYGTFAQHKDKLEALNRKGAGIFVTVNRTAGRGRKKSDIIGLTSDFVDLDTKDAKEPFDVSKLPIKPTMLVKSAGGWHGYWMFKQIVPCDKAKRTEYERDLKRICSALSIYGADLKCCDCSRILRLPGYFHRKADPVLITVESASDVRYAPEAVLEPFPVVESLSLFAAIPTGATPTGTRAVADDDSATVPPRKSNRGRNMEKIINYINKLPAAIQGNNGSRTTFVAALKLSSVWGLSASETYDLMLNHYNPRCRPAWSPDELWHKVKSAAHSAGRQS